MCIVLIHVKVQFQWIKTLEMNRNHPQPKRVINEWVERCETEQVLRKSSTNFQWDVSPGASGPYTYLIEIETETLNLYMGHFLQD